MNPKCYLGKSVRKESVNLVAIKIKPLAKVGRPEISKEPGSWIASLSTAPALDFVPPIFS